MFKVCITFDNRNLHFILIHYRKSNISPLPSKLDCKENFKCKSEEKCIPKGYVCDGDIDCDDGSDENIEICRKDCNKNQFRCADQKSCITKFWICDGAEDCNDGSDEMNC